MGFKGLDKGAKIMEDVSFSAMDLSELNQDRLVHCLVDKIKSFTHGCDGWGNNFSLKKETVKELLNNIITRPVNLKSLVLFNYYDFSAIINPEDLKKLLNKMTTIRLTGTFTAEQIEAARSLPDVKIGGFSGGDNAKFI